MTLILDDAPLVIDETLDFDPTCDWPSDCEEVATHAGKCLRCKDVTALCDAHTAFVETHVPHGHRTLYCTRCFRRGFVGLDFEVVSL